jgi:hypothetical protein
MEYQEHTRLGPAAATAFTSSAPSVPFDERAVRFVRKDYDQGRTLYEMPATAERHNRYDVESVVAEYLPIHMPSPGLR